MFAKFPPALYKGLSSRDGNLFMSPFSVQVALGMALAGAEGETKRQLAEAIDGPKELLITAYRALVEEARPASDEIELATANAAWVDRRFNLKQSYIETLRSFGGDVQQVNYGQPGPTCDKINGWVSNKTKTKIDKLVGPDNINSATRLILTNAIYFKGKWDQPFNPERTKPQDFYLKARETTKVPMMTQKAHYRYFENSLFQAIEMPYQGMTTGMLIVLPRDNDSLAGFEEAWDDEFYNIILRELSGTQEVVVTVPKFKITTPVISLASLLTNDLGASLAFSDAADFSGISDEQVKIDDVLHKAFVDVGEEGTEAAAATAVSMMRCASVRAPAPPKMFTADHPFLFVIRNRKTDTVLFQGRVVDPR